MTDLSTTTTLVDFSSPSPSSTNLSLPEKEDEVQKSTKVHPKSIKDGHRGDQVSPASSPNLEEPGEPGDWARYHIRYLVVGLLALGSFSNAMNKGLMNTAIIAMSPQTNWSLIHAQNVQPSFSKKWGRKGGDSVRPEDDENAAICPLDEGGNLTLKAKEEEEEIEHPEFDWSEQRQNLVMGAFALGYVLALVPSGAITESMGGARLAGVTGTVLALFTFLEPWSARRLGYWALFGSRMVVGSTVAAMVPAFVNLVTFWIPDDEKSKAMATMSVGGSLGTIFLNLVSGALCAATHLDGGWPMVFYLTGFITILWLIAWCYLMGGVCSDGERSSDHPADHPLMTPQELAYISARTRLATPPRPPPPVTVRAWLGMVFSVPVLSLLYVKITHTWFLNLLATKAGTYMISILRMDLNQTAIFSTIYNSSQLLSILGCGVLSDLAIRKRWLPTRTATRKCFEAVSTFGTAVFIVGVARSWCDRASFLVSLSLAVACAGASIGGSGIVILDLTSDHASTLASIVSTITMLIGFVTPSLATMLMEALETRDKNNDPSVNRLHHRWKIVFYLSAAFYVSGGLVFMVFGSAERQKDWFKDSSEASLTFTSTGKLKEVEEVQEMKRQKLVTHTNLETPSKSLMTLYNRQRSSIFGEPI